MWLSGQLLGAPLSRSATKQNENALLSPGLHLCDSAIGPRNHSVKRLYWNRLIDSLLSHLIDRLNLRLNLPTKVEVLHAVKMLSVTWRLMVIGSNHRLFWKTGPRFYMETDNGPTNQMKVNWCTGAVPTCSSMLTRADRLLSTIAVILKSINTPCHYVAAQEN